MSDLLIDLVRQYSPSEQERSAVRCLVDWMQGHDFHAWIDEVGNACGQRGPADAPYTLLMLGHIDTVPGEIPVRIEDGILYGRGSVDAKGPLCAFAEAAAQATMPESWRVIVIGAVEEEAATSRGARYVQTAFTPDLCIIGEPSGADRITLGYKGRLLVDYTLRRPVSHSSRPEPTVGALGSAFWQAVLNWCEQQNMGYDRFFDQIIPSLRSINTSTDHFADTVHLRLGFRLPPRLSPDQVFEAISALAESDGEISASGKEQAYLGDKNNPLVRSMLAAQRAQGNQPGFVLKGGTSDMNVVGTTWTCPIIAYGPGDSSLDHTPDEHIALAEYARAVAVLRHVIEQLNP
jgi:LysW-gamma-L-lysine carboxypeptidase